MIVFSDKKNNLLIPFNLIKRNLIFIIFCSLILIISCKKPPKEDKTIYVKEHLMKVVELFDSNISKQTTNYFYNDSNQVIEISNNGFSDTFKYVNNLLSQSAYGFDSNYTKHPYATSDYFYVNNILSTSIYNSRLFAKVSSNQYYYDVKNRLDSLIQNVEKPGLGIGTFYLKFEYDENSNLSKIYKKDEGGKRYLEFSFSDYDTHPNPYYKMPPIFDVEYDLYGATSLSKNNFGKSNQYYTFDPDLYIIKTCTYTYDLKGRVATSYTKDINAKYMSGVSLPFTSKFIYNIQ